MRKEDKRVTHCLVRTAEPIRSGTLGLVRWLTGRRGEEQPIGEPELMFNAYAKGIRAGRLCIAVESPELAEEHLGAQWEIVSTKTLGPAIADEDREKQQERKRQKSLLTVLGETAHNARP